MPHSPPPPPMPNKRPAARFPTLARSATRRACGGGAHGLLRGLGTSHYSLHPGTTNDHHQHTAHHHHHHHHHHNHYRRLTCCLSSTRPPVALLSAATAHLLCRSRRLCPSSWRGRPRGAPCSVVQRPSQSATCRLTHGRSIPDSIKTKYHGLQMLCHSSLFLVLISHSLLPHAFA